jgi:hypothetical protein
MAFTKFIYWGDTSQPAKENCAFLKDDSAACLNTQNTILSQTRLDNPNVWIYYIVPSIVVGGIVGYFIKKR